MKVHLYDKVYPRVDSPTAFCGQESILPGVDAVPAKVVITPLPNVTYCQKCLDSEERVLWQLQNI